MWNLRRVYTILWRELNRDTDLQLTLQVFVFRQGISSSMQNLVGKNAVSK